METPQPNDDTENSAEDLPEDPVYEGINENNPQFTENDGIVDEATNEKDNFSEKPDLQIPKCDESDGQVCGLNETVNESQYVEVNEEKADKEKCHIEKGDVEKSTIDLVDEKVDREKSDGDNAEAEKVDTEKVDDEKVDVEKCDAEKLDDAKETAGNEGKNEQLVTPYHCEPFFKKDEKLEEEVLTIIKLASNGRSLKINEADGTMQVEMNEKPFSKKTVKTQKGNRTKIKYNYHKDGTGTYKTRGGLNKNANLDSESDEDEGKAPKEFVKNIKKKTVTHRKFDKCSASGSDEKSKGYDKIKSRSCEHDREKSAKKEYIFPAKIVVRRLPPNMTSQMFISQVSPIPDYNSFYFVKADNSYSPHNFSRAYINFVNVEDIYTFKDKFDNYVFVDVKGNEFPAVVEFAIFQRIPKRGRFGRKKDNKCGTIESDPAYLRFVEEFTREPVESTESKPEYSFHIKEVAKKGSFVSTPLIEYINMRKQERIRIRDERKEERRKREIERKRIKDEERRKRRTAAKDTRDKPWKSLHEDDSDAKEELKFEKDDIVDVENVDGSPDAAKKSYTFKKDGEDGDKHFDRRDSHGFDRRDSQGFDRRDGHGFDRREGHGFDRRDSHGYGVDRIESTSFSKTRRESFGSDRSDFARGGKRDRGACKNVGRKPDTYGRSDVEHRGPKPFKKEPFKIVPRFVPSDKMGKDGFGREDRFSKFRKGKPDYTPKPGNFYDKDYKEYKKTPYKKNFEDRHEGFVKKTQKIPMDADVPPVIGEKKSPIPVTDGASKSSAYKEPEQNASKLEEGETLNDRNAPSEASNENSRAKYEGYCDEVRSKDDPRKQRRIRNKDRPAMAIYRPGMIRITKDKRPSDADEAADPRPAPDE